MKLLSGLTFAALFLGCLGDSVRRVDDVDLESTIKKDKNVLVLYCENDLAEQCARVQHEMAAVADAVSVPSFSALVVFDSAFGKQYQFKTSPQLLFYRSGMPILYYADQTNNMGMMEWVERNQDIYTKQLTDENFEHDTQATSGSTTGDWFIMFYDSTKCSGLVPTWEALASRMKNRLVIGAVDTKTNKNLYQRFKLNKCLTLLFLRQGSVYEYNLPNMDIPSLASFAEGWYRNVQSVKVPAEPSPFDRLTENIVRYLKENLGDSGSIIIGAVCSLLLLVAVIVCCAVVGGKQEKPKKE